MIDEIHREHEDFEKAREHPEVPIEADNRPVPQNADGSPKSAEDLEKWRENWKRHKKRGNWRRVIISAEIDLATKSSGNINVDLWYANIYELFNSGWDLVRFSEIQFLFKDRVQITPRLITNSCMGCSADEKKKLCV